ncbi:bifunctional DNA-formamidopyrimidine glycosylase/DNA-(apurinic or apyrimidinic site) lyase [Pseudonocardiaceae bacterium YIM PH 21723]|nr:bifunctional DNA-formamidopyrimidine glycosylase/DNA-(apurinic or apyrimidinic site) lyase [Pseudonocardiaceae bacterium YIM PH 21723]
MPELPEVEVVRRGLEAHVVGRTISVAEVLHPRVIRRHALGQADFVSRLAGRTVHAARRRGKYLWLDLADGDGAPNEALLGHLGMSGQMLVQPATAPAETHLRARFGFADAGPELRFVDQRTFGGLAVADLVPASLLPQPVAHIAADPLDELFDLTATVANIRRKRTEIKRALLDQSLISGIGNIYADEALWRAQVHWARPTHGLTKAKLEELLLAATEVMNEALGQGGTSFDALYVNVNGQSGYFDRSLNAYGQQDKPCGRCGTLIRRDPFMNRSSFSCPTCQPAPR